jgi:hypothetical protein
MKRLLLLAVITAFVLPTLLSAASKSYDVVPYANCIAQTTISNSNVTQYYRNTLDSITMVSFWMGDRGDGAAFNVEVWDSAGPKVAHRYDVPAPSQSWSWLNIPLTKDVQPVRGRTYYVKIFRSGGGGISFAYDPRNPYIYGKAVANLSTPNPMVV